MDKRTMNTMISQFTALMNSQGYNVSVTPVAKTSKVHKAKSAPAKKATSTKTTKTTETKKTPAAPKLYKLFYEAIGVKPEQMTAALEKAKKVYAANGGKKVNPSASTAAYAVYKSKPQLLGHDEPMSYDDLYKFLLGQQK